MVAARKPAAYAAQRPAQALVRPGGGRGGPTRPTPGGRARCRRRGRGPRPGARRAAGARARSRRTSTRARRPRRDAVVLVGDGERARHAARDRVARHDQAPALDRAVTDEPPAAEHPHEARPAREACRPRRASRRSRRRRARSGISAAPAGRAQPRLAARRGEDDRARVAQARLGQLRDAVEHDDAQPGQRPQEALLRGDRVVVEARRLRDDEDGRRREVGLHGRVDSPAMADAERELPALPARARRAAHRARPAPHLRGALQDDDRRVPRAARPSSGSSGSATTGSRAIGCACASTRVLERMRRRAAEHRLPRHAAVPPRRARRGPRRTRRARSSGSTTRPRSPTRRRPSARTRPTPSSSSRRPTSAPTPRSSRR